MKTFDDHWKLYVFKNKNISLSLRVTSFFVLTFHFDFDEFEMMLDNWREGVQFRTNKSLCVEHKYKGKPDEYVRFTIDQYNFRFTVEEFEQLERSYYHQIANEMPWDE